MPGLPVTGCGTAHQAQRDGMPARALSLLLCDVLGTLQCTKSDGD